MFVKDALRGAEKSRQQEGAHLTHDDINKQVQRSINFPSSSFSSSIYCRQRKITLLVGGANYNVATILLAFQPFALFHTLHGGSITREVKP